MAHNTEFKEQFFATGKEIGAPVFRRKAKGLIKADGHDAGRSLAVRVSGRFATPQIGSQQDKVQFFTSDARISDPEVREKAKTRFKKEGENAGHRHTVRMRKIKDSLRLTMPQLVSQFNKYEREFQKENFKKADDKGPMWLPMSVPLLSSYMQGWVMQESYMAMVRDRLDNFFKYKSSNSNPFTDKRDMREIMDVWFSELAIDPKSDVVSPYRQLARLIAPHYKRPVLASVAGVFNLGAINQGWREYTITTAGGDTHVFWLDAKEAVLIPSKKEVSIGEVIQYSVLIGIEKRDSQYVTTNLPSPDHTVFFRWYTKNKMPRSVETISLVDAAVTLAAARLKEVK